MIIENLAITEDGHRYKLTDGEMKIVRALRRLEKLWKAHGDRLILFNGNNLRICKFPEGSYFINRQIETYSIKGDGGEGGDREEDSLSFR